jgi:hypothetical protein
VFEFPQSMPTRDPDIPALGSRTDATLAAVKGADSNAISSQGFQNGMLLDAPLSVSAASQLCPNRDPVPIRANLCK